MSLFKRNILNNYMEKKLTLKIRNAKEEDCKYLFDLRNHLLVRKASFNPNKIDYETHKRWFAKTFDNPNKKIFIALNKTPQKIGMVRFDKEENSAKISIAISPDMHGKGYGTKLLSQGCNKYLKKELTVKFITAEIKKDNIASIKAFTKAGFTHWKDYDDKFELRLIRG